MKAQQNIFTVRRVPLAETRSPLFVSTGVMASLLVHGLLLTPVLWGGHHHRQTLPSEQGASASRQDRKSLESMLIVFVEDSEAIRDPSQDDETNDHFLLPKPPILPITQPRVAVADLGLIEDPDDRPVSEANGDQTGHSLLFGRYIGQISARVERAWVRPRSVPATGSFNCRAQITQDRHGNVQEVMLEKCTEDPRWQVTLVQAINSASPFPAPPDLSVFSNLLTMEFDSDPYVAGGSEEGFESAARTEAAARSKQDTASESQRAEAIRTPRMRPDGSLDLRIVGSGPESNSKQ